MFLKKLPILITTILLIHSACVEVYEQEKYQHPHWLAGKLYEQIRTRDNLTLFSICLQLTGYDTLINTSGSFTVFAPSDQAFQLFFDDHPEYGNEVSNIPVAELERIVKSHIIQNAWSREQLQTLDSEGWIDPDDPENSEPRAYKKQTLMKNPDRKYWVKYKREKFTIVDSAESDFYKKVFTGSRKYVPVFFKDFFNVYDLNSSDYEFYFDRPFEGNNLYYANALVIEDGIFAENGFVYVLDRVIPPLLNAEEILSRGNSEGDYNSFRELIYSFPEFQSNMDETYKQPEAREGKRFDTLFNLFYPSFAFNIHQELTGPNTNTSSHTLRYQNGILAPTDVAFQSFIDEILTANSGYPHWPDFKSVPDDIRRIIINTHMTRSPVYPSDLERGIENGNGDLIELDHSSIAQKVFGSNSTFIGLNEVIVSRAFTSVTGPVYLRPGYSTFMYAMQFSRILPAITEAGVEYSFYPISDETFSVDSSLMANFTTDGDLTGFRYLDRQTESMVWWINPNEMAKRILNHVGTTLPEGIAGKEFIPNLAGNYIIVNNMDNTVSGASPEKFGWRGDSLGYILHPEPLDEPADNGKTWDVAGWFHPGSGTMSGVLAKYPRFLGLMEKTGLFNPRTYKFTFLSEGEFYTLFVPSDEAIDKYNPDTLPNEEIKRFIQYHFIKGEHIFTDGKKSWTDYETTRLDESSTDLSVRYSTLNVRPGIDKIEILDENDQPIIILPEAEGSTNIMVITDTDTEVNSILDHVTTAVLHEIDTVLIK